MRGHAYRVQPLPLEPGDRLLFFTDGMLERNTTSVDIDDRAYRVGDPVIVRDQLAARTPIV